MEAEHQGVRKGPRLAAEVAQIGDLEAHFLGDFPVYRLFDGFAGLHESRERGEHRRRPRHIARQQHLFALAHQHDDARRQARVDRQAAVRAALGAVGGVILGGGAATPAEAVVPVPLDDLLGASGKVEEIRFDTAKPCPQAGGGESFRRRTLGRERVAGAVVPAPQVVLVLHLQPHPAELVGGDRPWHAVFADGEHLLAQADEVEGIGEIDALGRRDFRHEARGACGEQRRSLACCACCYARIATIASRTRAECVGFAALPASPPRVPKFTRLNARLKESRWR